MLCNHPTWRGFRVWKYVEMRNQALQTDNVTMLTENSNTDEWKPAEVKRSNKHSDDRRGNRLGIENDPKCLRNKWKREREKKETYIEESHLYHFVSGDKLVRLLIFHSIVHVFNECKTHYLFCFSKKKNLVKWNESLRHIKSIHWILRFSLVHGVDSTHTRYALIEPMFAFLRT